MNGPLCLTVLDSPGIRALPTEPVWPPYGQPGARGCLLFQRQAEQQ
jgi:hypothetical protein